jgi:4-hydroxy-3-methylbut-2-enyl diphosphate reductase
MEVQVKCGLKICVIASDRPPKAGPPQAERERSNLAFKKRLLRCFAPRNDALAQTLMTKNIIKKLSEFGEGFKHRHENYSVDSISALRETGGAWELGGLSFHFPEHFGFCYGVDKAIDMVFETCERFSAESGNHKRIFLTDQLIHNPTINGKLREKGVEYVKRDSNNLLICEGLKPDDVVVVSAFGTDFRDILHLQEKGVTIVDSTCGAIINVWKRVEGYAKNGFITVVHGKRNHEETRATVSQAVKEDGSYIIIENMQEARELAAGIRSGLFTGKIGMANQTTMLKGESLEIQNLLRSAFIERFGQSETNERFRSFDTICGATQDRQDALRNLLKKPLDLLLIVGGFNSSNTTHLAEIASADKRLPFFHIESADDIVSVNKIRVRSPQTGKVSVEEGWFAKDAKNIGITSGASTPDVTLFEIIQKITLFSQ